MFWGRRGWGTKHQTSSLSSNIALSLSQEKMFNYPLGWNICHEAPDLAWLVLILQPSGQAVSLLSDGARLVPSNRKWIIVISATASCAVQSGLRSTRAGLLIVICKHNQQPTKRNQPGQTNRQTEVFFLHGQHIKISNQKGKMSVSGE